MGGGEFPSAEGCRKAGWYLPINKTLTIADSLPKTFPQITYMKDKIINYI